MAEDAGAARSIAAAVLQTFAGAVDETGPDRFVPELVALLQHARRDNDRA
jgi:hypothetical protein